MSKLARTVARTMFKLYRVNSLLLVPVELLLVLVLVDVLMLLVVLLVCSFAVGH